MLIKGNFFNALPSKPIAEQFECLYQSEGLKIERICSHQHASPAGFWYDQEQAEWVLLMQGAAQLEFTDAPALTLHAGDYLLIPAHQRHRVAWTAPETLWLAIHFTA